MIRIWEPWPHAHPITTPTSSLPNTGYWLVITVLPVHTVPCHNPHEHATGERTGILPHVAVSRVPITGLLFISVVLALISGRAV